MQSNFHKLVWVKCPKCTSKGVVNEIKTGCIETSFGIPYTHARFTCSNCDFQLNNLDKNNAVQEVWYSKRELGFVESNRCSACGVEGTIGLPKISFKCKELIDVLLKCSGCNQVREYQLLWERCAWFKAGVDKNFGLEFNLSNLEETIIFQDKIGRIRDIQVHSGNGKIYFLAGNSLWLMEKKIKIL